MIFGYLLTREQRTKGETIEQEEFMSQYEPSKSMLSFSRNSDKIATILNLNEKIDEMAFDLDEKKSSSEILKEQSIIAGVSSWEGYFSDICEIILNDDKFIDKLYKNKEKLRKFLNEFKLMQDFNTEILLNENKINGLRFGTFIRKARKINFQNIEDLKVIFKLYDIDPRQIHENNIWKEITDFIKERHEIVHNPNNQSIVNDYSKDEIEGIIKNMSNIINTVDKLLFTKHSETILLPASL